MSESSPLSAEQFSRRLVELCLRSNLSAIPKKELDQKILLKSAVLLLDPARAYSEKDLTQRLDLWVSEVCQIQHFDRVSLRRWLVDEGFVTRSADGSVYQVAARAAGEFDPAIERLDVLQVLEDARAEIARRKQEFINKAKER